MMHNTMVFCRQCREYTTDKVDMKSQALMSCRITREDKEENAIVGS